VVDSAVDTAEGAFAGNEVGHHADAEIGVKVGAVGDHQQVVKEAAQDGQSAIDEALPSERHEGLVPAHTAAVATGEQNARDAIGGNSHGGLLLAAPHDTAGFSDAVYAAAHGSVERRFKSCQTSV
jgi:hypothetical protein